MTSRPLAALSVTVKLMLAVVAGSLPSVTALAFPTDTVGVASSSVMVPVASRVALPPFSVALLAEESRSTTVSLSSSRLSPVTVTETVLLVSPAAKVSVPAVSAA